VNARWIHRTLTVAALSTLVLAGADWTRFRGPQGAGTSTDTGLPVTWSATENIVWKTAMPGFGSSSPITLGKKIYITCYSGYGLDEDNPGEQKNLKLHLLCVDRESGKILWDSPIPAKLPERDFQGFVALHGYASFTPVTDGENIYVFWGRTGAVAYDLNGKQLWSKDLGTKTHGWGSAASPILAGDILVVNACVESGTLYGLNKKTGEVVWEADGIDDSWSTPALVDLPNGKQEVVLSMKNKVLGFDPASGKQLWSCDSVRDYVCPITVVDKDVVFLTGGRTPLTVAIRCGGKGDVTESHLLWKTRKCSKVPSPLVADGLLYWLDNTGTAGCLDAKTGEVVYRERTKLGVVYASLVMAEGRLYGVSRKKGAIVYAAGKEFKELAQNDLGDESVFDGTPTIHNGQLLLRSNKFLYCIGK
jgi:outer membrane protein assembly factor BamB